MRTLAVILARGGSERLKDKNLRELGGIPLVSHAILAAKSARKVDTVVLSTDSREIGRLAEKHDVLWIPRPEKISGPEASTEEALLHALLEVDRYGGPDHTHVVGLRASIPFRPAGLIDAMLDHIEDNGNRGGITMVQRTPWQWTRGADGKMTSWWDPSEYPRSQEVKELHYEEISAVQIGLRNEVLKRQRWASPLTVGLIPGHLAVDIDDEEDLRIAERIYCAHGAEIGARREHQLDTVRVPIAEFHERRWCGPCRTNWFKGKHIGVVLGNGPQIDALPDAAFRILSAPTTITVGVNRIASSMRLREAGFWPNVHFIWDPPDSPPKEEQKLRIAGLFQMRGKTWRVGQSTDRMDAYHCDQFVPVSTQPYGDIEKDGVRLRNNSCDGAVNLLYRMGIREVYLFGVEMNCNQHLRLMCDVGQDTGIWDQESCVGNALHAWRLVQETCPDLVLRCACSTSRLVKEGVVPFGVPPGMESFNL